MLHHFTCSHGWADILAMSEPAVLPLNLSRPDKVRRLPDTLKVLGQVAWFTDLDTPDIRGLGLTQLTIRCDRTKHRFTVVGEDEALVVPWSGWRREHPHPMWASLELSEGAMPAHWWVSPVPVRVEES